MLKPPSASPDKEERNKFQQNFVSKNKNKIEITAEQNINEKGLDRREDAISEEPKQHKTQTPNLVLYWENNIRKLDPRSEWTAQTDKGRHEAKGHWTCQPNCP